MSDIKEHITNLILEELTEGILICLGSKRGTTDRLDNLRAALGAISSIEEMALDGHSVARACVARIQAAVDAE